ncbi:hypothetical protein LSAT2_016217 [Lamellibrachia satsuma]|nr:hypothetical protein LSAT2_016217 [Lamellibrachia satsuma]
MIVLTSAIQANQELHEDEVSYYDLKNVPEPRIVNLPIKMNVKLSVVLVVVVGCCLIRTTNSAPVTSYFDCLMDCSERLSRCARNCAVNGIETGKTYGPCISLCGSRRDCERSCSNF